MEINHNISSVKVGETICYHIGNLAADRIYRPVIGVEKVERKTKNGIKIKEKDIYGDITDNAITLGQVADQLYKRSFATWGDGMYDYYGTKEFILYQKKEGYGKYAYMAKRISDKPVIKKPTIASAA